ncbi:hypothetical protein [Pedosphaera parvula]|uniref:hypothetical protein n=1 Tax=Pedosphaera parvula TaxID=1032527 RepID=UPI001ED8E195|nr:hypothetical protein [Pedosphaera parvula]
MIPGVDPVEMVKSAQDARAEKIGRRIGMVMMVAILGMAILQWPGFIVDSSHLHSWKHVYDISLIQRVYFMWFCLFFSCIAITILAAFGGKFAGSFSAKLRTPSVLIGLIGLSILIIAAVVFFSRPYTGTSLNLVDGRYFMGGWFLLVWGIVFRK